MRTIGQLGLVLSFLCRPGASDAAPVPAGREAARLVGGPIEWLPFPEEHLHVHGLPWFDGAEPRLWRFPRSSIDHLPAAVNNLMRFPAGGRLRFRSDTTTLWLKVSADHVSSMRHMSPIGVGGIDAYLDETYWGSAAIAQEGEQELLVFRGGERKQRSITLYLPPFQRLEILALALDRGSQVLPPEPFSRPLPIVYYGSSIAQGACASRPGMSYEAILSRRLGVDFVNLGFSGSGKAEPEVVDLVAAVGACCYVLDLGKSFGSQPAAVYVRMLETLRAARPSVPIVCVTPIFSTKELYDCSYQELSVHVRTVVTQAVRLRADAGDTCVHLVDGLQLLGSGDTDAFQEGVHPTDLGFFRIAERLEPTLRRVLATGR